MNHRLTLSHPFSFRLRGASLLEVSASVSALAVLTTLLLPALGEARRQGKEVQCIANLSRIAEASFIYAAADRNEFAMPVHPLALAAVGSIGEQEWGGKSGAGDVVAGDDPLASRWGTAEGRGPATRPLNKVMYRDSFPDHQLDPGVFGTNWLDDTRLNLDEFHCPGDIGYTGHHYVSFRDGGLTGYEHYGNSYTVTASWIGVSGGGCKLYSNAAYMRPISRVPVPGRTLMYLETAGRFAWRRNYGIDDCSFLNGSEVVPGPPMQGWHGRDSVFVATFVDGHVASTSIDGHNHPQTDSGRYPTWNGQQTSWGFWHCVIIRGDDWQQDTLPAPPIPTDVPCGGTGGGRIE